jgi:hypothetical protein
MYRLRHLLIYSTTFQTLLTSHLNMKTSLIATSQMVWRMSRTLSNGGMRGIPPFPVYRAWLVIILPFPVSIYLITVYFVLIIFEATTVGVEQVFSQGRLVLPYIRNHLSSQTTRALMCIGAWSLLGLVKDADIKAALGDEINGPEDERTVGWDNITGTI